MALRLKRSPQLAGGDASSRIRWRRRPLRSTPSTCPSCSGCAWRIPSVQRSVPPRTTTSVCEKSQSATALWPLSASLDTSSPPTKIFPSAPRRMSSSGRSITSCSKPSCQSEVSDSVPSRRGRRTASRPSLSSRLTSWSSNDGIIPSERAVMPPMRTATPSTRLASTSRRGRNSPIRGTIQPWSSHQPRTNSSHAPATSQSRRRSTAAVQRRRRDGKAVKLDGGCELGSIALRIMTAGAFHRQALTMKFCEVPS